MDKNIVLFVALSVVILFGWSYVQQKVLPPSSNNVQQSTVSDRTVSQQPLNSSIQSSVDKEIVKKQENLVVKEFLFETDNEKVVINTQNAAVRHWYIKDRAKEYDIVESPSASLLATLPETNFKIDENSSENKKISFSTLTPNKILIKKTYQFVNNAGTDKNCVLQISIINPSKEDKILDATVLSFGPGLGGRSDKKVKEDLNPYRAIMYRNKLVEKLKKGENPSDFSWIGLDNRYYLFVLVPTIPESMKNLKTVMEEIEPGKMPLVSMNTQMVVSGKSTADFEFNVYARTKKYNELKKVVSGTKNIRLEKGIDLGIFGFLSKIALDVLNFFYSIFKNYGVAIILMTAILQVLIYPLTWKSFQATLGMKKVQPLMTDLQAKYKNDPQRLQSEMLHLYKTHKVNPLSGCLPMLLQLPIFWALFTTLRDAYELRQAGFIFWIKDLSTRDPFYVLPVLMGVVMFLQQKITTPVADPSQKMMIYLFPIIFTVMFLQFPSGLVLYWFVSSLMGFGIQMYLLQQSKQPKKT